MKVPLFPSNENKRLEALRSLELLDTQQEEAFDEIVRLASYVTGCPVSLISLVDSDRQWFKARHGLDVTETPRDISFCGHTILGEELLVVENALDDERFSDNPLVASDPKIRFYAGEPLITSDGFKIGTLCSIDLVPRKLSPDQRSLLASLAGQAMRLIEHRATLKKQNSLDTQLINFQSEIQNLQGNLQKLFEKTDVIVAFMKGLEHIFEYVNPAHIKLLGGVNATGRKVREVQPEGDRIIELLDEAYVTGKTNKMLQAPFQVGEDIHYFDFIFTPSRNASGEIDGVMALVNDISRITWAQKRSEESESLLKKTQEQLLLALDSAQMGTWSIDLKTEIVTTSPSFAAIFGVPEVEGNIFEEISRYMHPDDVAEVNRVWTHAVATKTFYNHEYRIVWPDGSIHWVQSKGTVKFDAEGDSSYFSGVLSDVTDRVVARRRIEESEARIQQIANAMPQIVWTARPDGVLNYTNDRWFQYSGSNDPGKWLSFVSPEDIDQVIETWTHCVNTGEKYETEFRLRKQSDQSYRWFLVRAQPSYESDGKILHWIGTCTDVQDQKSALEARSKFMSIASHELKTPLTSLKLQTQSMRRNFSKGRNEAFSLQKVGELIDNNEKQIGRLIRLVDDMLDFAKMEAGKLSMVKEDLDFGEIVSDVYSRLKEQLDSADCDSSLSCDGPILGLADRFRIEQVITNLLTNAVRYGRGKPVRIVAESDGQDFLLSVQDHGIGIAPENIDRIFHRFERAVSANEVSGLGLGLFISQQIVEAHQGRIWVGSELGSGSTFYVKLPLKGVIS